MIFLVHTVNNRTRISWNHSRREFIFPIGNNSNHWMVWQGAEIQLPPIVAGAVWYAVLKCCSLKHYSSIWRTPSLSPIQIFKSPRNVTHKDQNHWHQSPSLLAGPKRNSIEYFRHGQRSHRRTETYREIIRLFGDYPNVKCPFGIHKYDLGKIFYSSCSTHVSL